MRQIDVGGILHQQHRGSGIRLVRGLLQVRLHQGCEVHIWRILANDTTLWSLSRYAFEQAKHPKDSPPAWWPLLPSVSCDAYRAVGRSQRFARPSSWDPTRLVCSSCIGSLGKMWVRITRESRVSIAISNTHNIPINHINETIIASTRIDNGRELFRNKGANSCGVNV